MPARNIVGRRVQEARRRLRPAVTQAQLAARLQLAGFRLDRGAVSKIETGQREVTDRELVALAAALAVSPDWLLSAQGTVKPMRADSE